MWRKITKNKLGLLGLIFITGLTIISLLGYFVIPDSSPNANDIHLEIALQKPGFSVDFLTISEIPQKKINPIVESLAFWFAKPVEKSPNYGVEWPR